VLQKLWQIVLSEIAFKGDLQKSKNKNNRSIYACYRAGE
jgi:hypothetical protein